MKEDLSRHDVTLNIRYDAPDEVWNIKIPLIYEQMPGWLGGEYGDQGSCWFGQYDDDDNSENKFIAASVEPGGLQLIANMEDDEWILWLDMFKKLATYHLGYEVKRADE